MNSCAFWKITLDQSAPAVELPSSETKNFAINASIQNGTVSLALSGRAQQPVYTNPTITISAG